jgi:hypothetical protein
MSRNDGDILIDVIVDLGDIVLVLVLDIGDAHLVGILLGNDGDGLTRRAPELNRTARRSEHAQLDRRLLGAALRTCRRQPVEIVEALRTTGAGAFGAKFWSAHETFPIEKSVLNVWNRSAMPRIGRWLVASAAQLDFML